MLGLRYRDELPEEVARELDAINAKLKAFLLREHNEDGTHSFDPEGELSLAIDQIIDGYQRRGQWWKIGPWLINDPDAAEPNAAIIRPTDPAAGTYNNYAPAGIETAVGISLEPTGDISITGLKTHQRIDQDRFLFFRNRDSSNTVTLKHENTGSLEAYRFDLPGDADLVIQPNGALWLYYEHGRQRWVAAVPESTSTISAQGAAAQCVFDGGGAALTAGKTVYCRAPYAMTIKGWFMVADQSGSAEVRVYKDTFANFPPNSADEILASERPTLSSVQKNSDTALVADVSVAEGDWIAFSLQSVSILTWVYVQLYGTKV